MSTFMLSRIFSLKPALRYKLTMKTSLSTLSTGLTWLHFVESSRGCKKLSNTCCMFLSVYCKMLSIISSVKESFNDEDGFFTDLSARGGPGLFLYTFSAALLWICLSLFIFHSIFTFFLESVYSKLRPACGGALSQLLSFSTSSRVLNFCFCCIVAEFSDSFDVFSFTIFFVLMSPSIC